MFQHAAKIQYTNDQHYAQTLQFGNQKQKIIEEKDKYVQNLQGVLEREQKLKT